MRTTRILILLMIPLIIEVVVACCNCDDIPFTNYSTYWYYTNNGILISNIDNSGPEPLVARSDSVMKCAYGIRVVIDRVELEQDTTATYWGALPRQKPKPHWEGLIQSAYAFEPCHCEEERVLIPADTINSIEIISNNNFDTQHPAGSDITNLFQISYNDYFIQASYIPEYSSIEYYEDMNLIMILNLLLMQEPENKGPHDFTVRLTLSDARILEQSTQIRLY